MQSRVSRKLRPAAVAGRFYPGQPEALRGAVTAYLRGGAGIQGSSPKAVVAPHAGYLYSGPIAGSAFGVWRGETEAVRRVVVVGPAHYVGFTGIGVSSASAFETPLGQVEVDGDAVERVCSIAGVHVEDDAHRPEHSIEVELPFLQCILGGWKVVPLLVGETGYALVAQVLEGLWGGPETRVVVSSDLSHYLDYGSAQSKDAATARAIVALDVQGVTPESACGSVAIQGLLQVAHARGMRVQNLDLRNSGDTAGPRDRVVGYGAFAFEN